jgi:flavin-dependent dehydrogenase
LLRHARAGGVEVREGEPVVGFVRERDGVLVETRHGAYRTRVLIGADGAKSRVRSALVGPTGGERFVALELLTPGHDGPDGAANTAVFDFRPVAHGLRGYAWHFPSLKAGERWTNRGLGGTRWPRGESLLALFRSALRARGIEPRCSRIEGWSAPLYHPDSPKSAERVLLAGDAIGVDPWLGEGISVALGTGIVAANAAADALGAGRFDFADYRERIHESAVGWQLERQRNLADPFYEAAAALRGLAPWLGQGAIA